MEKKTDRQKNWCWCSKCEGLFYVDKNWLSFCPAGGNHDESFFKDFAYSVNIENAVGGRIIYTSGEFRLESKEPDVAVRE